MHKDDDRISSKKVKILLWQPYDLKSTVYHGVCNIVEKITVQKEGPTQWLVLLLFRWTSLHFSVYFITVFGKLLFICKSFSSNFVDNWLYNSMDCGINLHRWLVLTRYHHISTNYMYMYLFWMMSVLILKNIPEIFFSAWDIFSIHLSGNTDIPRPRATPTVSCSYSPARRTW